MTESSQSVTALLTAALAGDTTRIASILEADPGLVNQLGLLPGHTGLRTALHHAVSGEHEPAVALLLDRGANPDIRDEGDDATPLHFAAEKNHLGIIRLLVEHGADTIGDGTWHELDILGWATVFGPGRTEVIDYLLSHRARWTISSAVSMGANDEIRRLVAEDPAVLLHRMDVTNLRRTPLHLAVVKERPDTAALLLELGADPSLLDAGGLTPLAQAAFLGQRDLADRMIAAGAPLDLPAAVALGREDDIARLVAAEPGSLAIGGRWETIIVRAAEASTGSIVAKLLQHGASVHARDRADAAVDQTAGYTPLHAAAYRGNADAVTVLMEHGADVAARETRYSGSPAGWAQHGGHLAVRDQILAGPIDLFDAVDFNLVERVPDIVARDPGSLCRRFADIVGPPPAGAWWAERAAKTPIDVARALGMDEMVRVLLANGGK